MAELTIEQKAERYDAAIKRAKSKIKNDKDHILYEDDVLEIFPELAESNGSRIIKVIRGWILTRPALFFDNGISKEEILAWLDNQAEKEKFIEKEIGNIHGYREEALGRLQELEKQCLQNPSESSEEVELIPDTDKPKFAVGAYVTDDGETYFHIIGYTNNTYQLETVDGTSNHFRQEFIEKKYRLWSIEDAKEGDVLAAHECLVLFKEIDGLNIKCYCTYHFMNTPMFHVDTLQNKRAFCPATRKQQVLFFQKLKEAGYEWNKKELLRIERKSAMWSEDDEKQLRDIIELLPDLSNRHTWLKSLKDRIRQRQEWSPDDAKMLDTIIEDIVKLAGPRVCYHKDVDWLKSLKDRIQPNQDWSEEDSVRLQRIIDFLWCNRKGDTDSIYQQEQDIDWLKFIRSKKQWKPSKEQLNALESTLQYGQISKVSCERLNSLFNDLKKLK